ncbi:MAG: GNAT family N-acetyltransferase [Sterolibacterium sp.]
MNLGDYRIETGAWLTLAPRAQTLREPDEFDPDSLHALASDAAGKAIGTGRLLTEGQIGRMAVSPEWRNQGVGTAIVRYLLEAAGSQGIHQVFVNAQTSEARFYSRFGFSPAGVEFTEAESAYVQMRVSLRV